MMPQCPNQTKSSAPERAVLLGGVLTRDRRGLNAAADKRTGRYKRGKVIELLAGDPKRAAGQASRALDDPMRLFPSSRLAPL
jgi:hypothetical protein